MGAAADAVHVNQTSQLSPTLTHTYACMCMKSINKCAHTHTNALLHTLTNSGF